MYYFDASTCPSDIYFPLFVEYFLILQIRHDQLYRKPFIFFEKMKARSTPEFCFSKHIVYALDHCLFFACASGSKRTHMYTACKLNGKFISFLKKKPQCSVTLLRE